LLAVALAVAMVVVVVELAAFYILAALVFKVVLFILLLWGQAAPL
jgi:hypothetical protein